MGPATLSPQAEQLLDYLQKARDEHGPMRITPDRPISGTLLATRFGLKDSREVRDLVHEIRKHGHWIAANNKGYYAARTWDEIRETVRTLQRLSKSTAIPAQAMIAAASKVDQLELL